MTNQTATYTYDAIGEGFEAFTDTASQRSIETATFFHMVGDVKGNSVLYLDCCFGFFASAYDGRIYPITAQSAARQTRP